MLAIVLALASAIGYGGSDSVGARSRAAGRAVTGGGGAARGVAFGLVAGAGFALLFIGLDRAGSGSGMWPVAAAAAGELAAAAGAAVLAGLAARRVAAGGGVGAG